MIIFETNLVIFGHCAKGYNSLLPPGSLELGRTLVASSARIKAQRSHAHNNERKNLVLVQAKLVSIKNLDYCTHAIMTSGLYTFYPLFEVHLCTVTFGLMYG